VEAHERPVGGEDMSLEGLDLGAVADHEGRVVRAQQLVHRLGEPAGVPELERVPTGGKLGEG